MKRLLLSLFLLSSHSLALDIAPPQITVIDATNGTTSLDGVSCLLCAGLNAGTVEGVVSVRTALLSVGVSIETCDTNGNLLVSCPLGDEKKGKASIFSFIMKKEFVTNGKLTIFTKDHMYELHLQSVPVRTENVDMQSALKLLTIKTEEGPTKPSTPTK